MALSGSVSFLRKTISAKKAKFISFKFSQHSQTSIILLSFSNIDSSILNFHGNALFQQLLIVQSSGPLQQRKSIDSVDYEKNFFLYFLNQSLSEICKSVIRSKQKWFSAKSKRFLMEIQNSDNDNVLRIWVSIHTVSDITIKATFCI